MSAVVRGNARALPLADDSVDLIVTSPPYFALRSYRDGGEHYDGQIGSEPHPQEFLEALWEVTAECWRVLKPSGSMFVNLGDKRSGSGAPGTTSGLAGTGQHLRAATSGSERGTTLQGTPQQRAPRPIGEVMVQGARSGMLSHVGDLAGAGEGRTEWKTRAYTQEAFGRAKSKMLLPHRYAIGCEDGAADPDGIGWIVRQDLVWSKPNGLPESVRDRTRDAHEYWFHLTKDGDYFAAVDEIRDPSSGYHRDAVDIPEIPGQKKRAMLHTSNPLGSLPRSVWEIATEPLTVPKELGVDHFAAFPSEWPRRLILGWSPPGICLECSEGRRPVVDVEHELYRDAGSTGRVKRQDGEGPRTGNGFNGQGYLQTRSTATIVGYACACTPFTDHPERRRKSSTPKRDDGAHRPPEDLGHSNTLPTPGLPVREYHLAGWTAPPTRPAVVLDPFGGTGTTAMVARALGRTGISIDLSADYCRLARWRIFQSGHGAKAVARTNNERQGVLL